MATNYVPSDMGKVAGGMITYVALPHPLPLAWKQEFIAHAKFKAGDAIGLEALDRRCRAAIGITVTRKFIPSISESRGNPCAC